MVRRIKLLVRQDHGDSPYIPTDGRWECSTGSDVSEAGLHKIKAHELHWAPDTPSEPSRCGS